MQTFICHAQEPDEYVPVRDIWDKWCDSWACGASFDDMMWQSDRVNVQPCPEAHAVLQVSYDVWSCKGKDEKWIPPARRGPGWFEIGRNHRVVKEKDISFHVREFDDICWLVDIDGLDGLFDFIHKHGAVMVGEGHVRSWAWADSESPSLPTLPTLFIMNGKYPEY